MDVFIKAEINKINTLRKITWISWNKTHIKSTCLNNMEEKQSRLLPSGYPLSGLIKLQPARGRHGLLGENNQVETKKLLGGKLCNKVLSEIYISRIREKAYIPFDWVLFFGAVSVVIYEMCIAYNAHRAHSV